MGQFVENINFQFIVIIVVNKHENNQIKNDLKQAQSEEMCKKGKEKEQK